LLLASLSFSLWSPGTIALSLAGWKNELVEFLLRKVSVPGQFEIAAGRIENVQAGRAVLKGVRISDQTGVWFEARAFDLIWSPSRLLKGEVVIDRLAITGGVLRRYPVVSPAEASSSGSERPLAWPRSPVPIEVKTLALRNFAVSEAILAKGVRFDATGTMRDTGDMQALTLAVRRIDGIRGRIAAALRRRFDSGEIALSLDAEEGTGGAVAGIIGAGANTPISLSLTAKGPPSNLTGEIDLGARDLAELSGTFATRWSGSFSADLTLALRPGPASSERIRAALGKRAKLELTLREGAEIKPGAAGVSSRPGVIVIERGRLASRAFTMTLSGSYARQTGALDLTLDAESTGKASQRLSDLFDDLRLERLALDGRLTGTVQLPKVSAHLLLANPELGGLRARAAKATLDLTGPLSNPRGRLVVNLDKPRAAAPGFDPLLGEKMTVRLLGHREGVEPSSSLRLDQAVLETTAGRFEASGSARWPGLAVLDLRYHAMLPDLGVFSALTATPLSGRAAGHGRLLGARARLRAEGTLEGTGVAVRGERLGTVSLRHRVTLARPLNGEVTLEMSRGNFGRGHARAHFRATDRTLFLSGLEVDLLDVAARGDLAVPRTARGLGSTSGAVDFEIRSLQPIGRLAGREMTGTGAGRLELSSEQGGTVSLKLAAGGVRVARTRVGALELSARGRSFADRPAFEARANVRSLTIGDLVAKEATLVAGGPLSGNAITLQAEGSWKNEPMRLTASARGKLSSGRRRSASDRRAEESGENRLRLDRVELALGADVVRLGKALSIDFASERGLTVSNVELELPEGGSIRGRANRSVTGTVTVEAKVMKAPLRMAGHFSSLAFTGGTLDAALRGTSAGPDAGLEASAQILHPRLPGAPESAAALRAVLTARWNGKRLRASGRITGPMASPAQFDAELPLLAAEHGLPRWQGREALEGGLRWHGDIEPLFALLPLPDHLLSGRADLDAALSGTLSHPLLSGKLALANGRYEHLVTGIVLEDLTAHARLTGDDRIDLQLRADDGVAGSLKMTGQARRLLSGAPELDVTARFEDLLVVRIDPAIAQASGELRISGNPRAAELSGRITVGRSELRLLNTLPPSVADIGVVRFKGEAPPGSAPLQTHATSPVALDLVVLAPGPLYIRGRGLESEWKGKLRVSGTAASPIVAGRITARRGRFELLGHPFALVKGAARFSRNGRWDPFLDLRLERTSNDITGRILVSGRASRPKLTLASSPPVAAGEVLPRVLFGRSSRSLSATEALQLAAGVANLLRGRRSTLDAVRDALGVDVLRIEQGEKLGATLNIGRYVREGLYIGARQGLGGSTPAIVVEAQMGKRIVVDADVSQSGESSVGVSWRKDF